MEHIDLLETVKQHRSETEDSDVDIILDDGTIVYRKGGNGLVAAYDDLIHSLSITCQS